MLFPTLFIIITQLYIQLTVQIIGTIFLTRILTAECMGKIHLKNKDSFSNRDIGNQTMKANLTIQVETFYLMTQRRPTLNSSSTAMKKNK